MGLNKELFGTMVFLKWLLLEKLKNSQIFTDFEEKYNKNFVTEMFTVQHTFEVGLKFAIGCRHNCF